MLRRFGDGPNDLVLIFALGAMSPRLKGTPRLPATHHPEVETTAGRRFDRPDPRSELARAVGPEVGLYSFDYPENLRVETLARELVAEARRVQPVGPYHLAGSSFGGLIAYEACGLLIVQGQDVAFLGLLDTRGPRFPRLVVSMGERLKRRWRTALARPLSKWPGHLIDRFRSVVSPEVSFARFVIRRKEEPAMVDHFADFRRQAAAYLGNVPRYPGPLTLFRAHLQYDTPSLSFEDETNGWGAVVDGAVRTVVIPGNHYTMLNPENTFDVGQSIRSCLLNARTGRQRV